MSDAQRIEQDPKTVLRAKNPRELMCMIWGCKDEDVIFLGTDGRNESGLRLRYYAIEPEEVGGECTGHTYIVLCPDGFYYEDGDQPSGRKCEFCKEHYDFEDILQHESLCDQNPENEDLD